MKTQLINTIIVGERLHQNESSADAIVSPGRHTASAFIASKSRALKKANTASGLHDEGDDDSGDPSANISSGDATPAAAKGYILSLRAKYDDASDIAINATRFATNERVHKSRVGLHWRVYMLPRDTAPTFPYLFLHNMPMTALELTL